MKGKGIRSMWRWVAVVGLVAVVASPGLIRAAEPISMGQLVGYRGILVPPVDKGDVTKLVDAGTIEVDGYTYMTLNLAGEMKENPTKQGAVGVLLVPDVPPFDTVLTHLNLVAVPLEIKAPVTADLFPYFMAKQVRFDIGFTRYRVLLYNTTGASAIVAVFAYRSR